MSDEATREERVREAALALCEKLGIEVLKLGDRWPSDMFVYNVDVDGVDVGYLAHGAGK